MPRKIRDQSGNVYSRHGGSGPSGSIDQYGKDQFGTSYTRRPARGTDAVVDQYGNVYQRDSGGSFLDGIVLWLLLGLFVLTWRLIALCIRRPKVGLPLTASILLVLHTVYAALIPPWVRAERWALLGHDLGFVSEASYQATANVRAANEDGYVHSPFYGVLMGFLDGGRPARVILFDQASYSGMWFKALAEYASVRPGLPNMIGRPTFYGHLVRDMTQEMETQAPFTTMLAHGLPVAGVNLATFGRGEIVLFALGLQSGLSLDSYDNYSTVTQQAIDCAQQGYARFGSISISLPRALNAQAMQQIGAYFPSQG